MADSFTYDSFHIDADQQTVAFAYELTHGEQSYTLTERLRFPTPLPNTTAIARGLRALHLALGISYYKIFVGPTISHPYSMDAHEADFWNDIWQGGLGEFLYINQLSPAILATFSAQDGLTFDGDDSSDFSESALLGIGGGKDSIVAGELLKACDVAIDGYVMATGEQLGQAKAVSDTMGVALHVIERSLDQQLLELQEQPGAYKGHVPISLVFGLVGTVLAAALGKQYVIVANEASASIPRITWEHGSVNHQWSKSAGFERTLQAYVHTAIEPAITYFSAVRQLTSIGVAKLFTRYSQYFEVFTSDNFVFRIDPSKRPNARWSLESPKSLSSFILLAPWLGEAELLRIFGQNFLDEPSLQTLFLESLGVEGEPPLDCIGTVEELVLSLNLAAEQGKFEASQLMQLARERGIVREAAWQAELAIMLTLQSEQALPEALFATVTNYLQQGLST